MQPIAIGTKTNCLLKVKLPVKMLCNGKANYFSKTAYDRYVSNVVKERFIK